MSTRTHRRAALGGLGCLLLALAGCPQEPLPDDETLAQELWTAIQGHEAWTQPEGYEGIVSSQSHTAFVAIYQNDVAAGWDGSDPAPDGAVFVKDAYNDSLGEDLVGWTAMWKVDGYAPDTGDWFWAEFNLDGTWVDGKIGAVAQCISCHAAGSEDYAQSKPGS